MNAPLYDPRAVAFGAAERDPHGTDAHQPGAKLDASKAARDRLRSRLHAVAYSASTRKALADALPEFAHYLPADEAKSLRTLPVVANVVADFVKAGWPKDKARKPVGKAAK